MQKISLGLLATLATGCATTIVDRLNSGDLKPKHEFCKMAPKLEGPTLAQMLEPHREKMKTHTGVTVLEDGAGAMVARAWMAKKAVRTIDIQYFIFSTDNVGLIGADLLLRAAERGSDRTRPTPCSGESIGSS